MLYGYFIGVVNSGLVAASYDLLLWAVPISFGLVIASDWRSFPMYRDAIFSVFLWGGAILGGYGIYQYFNLLPWDAYWMRNADISSVGFPFPLLVRVFSTMNSSTPFAAMIIPTLLIVFVAGSSDSLPGRAGSASLPLACRQCARPGSAGSSRSLSLWLVCAAAATDPNLRRGCGPF